MFNFWFHRFISSVKAYLWTYWMVSTETRRFPLQDTTNCPKVPGCPQALLAETPSHTAYPAISHTAKHFNDQHCRRSPSCDSFA